MHILDRRSDNSTLRKFAILLGVNGYRYAIVVIVVGTVMDDGYIVVLCRRSAIMEHI